MALYYLGDFLSIRLHTYMTKYVQQLRVKKMHSKGPNPHEHN